MATINRNGHLDHRSREAERWSGWPVRLSSPHDLRRDYLESIWVDPARRRYGVFRALLHKLADLERHMGVTELLLWVLEDNHTARHAYEAVGFRRPGSVSSYRKSAVSKYS